MVEAKFPGVWFSTKIRAESDDKLVVYDDIGRLSVSAETILFTGRKTTLTIPKNSIKGISLAEQKYPYKTLLKMSILSLVFWFPILLIGLVVGMIFAFISNNLLFIPICVVPIPILFIASVGLGVAIGKSMKWTKIDYEKEDKSSDSAYFYDSSFLGWGGLFGGSRRLFEQITTNARSRSSSATP